MGSDGILVSGGTVETSGRSNGGAGSGVTFGSAADSVAAINGGDGISVTDGKSSPRCPLQNQGAGVSLTRASGENLICINQGVECVADLEAGSAIDRAGSARNRSAGALVQRVRPHESNVFVG
ncbi:MAG: hypothetical protein R3F21_21605 [Myxococcota bacterium]